MKRLGAVALFAGAVLLSTHILAPAEPPPSPTSLPAADLLAVARAKPLIAQLDAQAERLRERLANPPAYPAPTRDPFRFNAPATPRKTSVTPAPAAPAAAPAQALPKVIAIATSTENGALVRTAVLGMDAEVQVVKPGDTFLNFSIESVGIDSVEILNPATRQTFKISLQ